MFNVATTWNPKPGGAFQPSAPAGGPVSASISAVDDAGRYVLRVDQASATTLAAALHIELPDRIGTGAGADGRRAFKLGPDEWRLLVEPSEGEAIEAQAAAMMVALPHSLVDVSDREIGFRVAGPAAREVLCAICPINLGGLQPGSATRTVLDRVAVMLICEGADCYRVEVWRSFAPFLVSLLKTIRREVEAGL